MIYPRISIVTPSFNQGKFLEETILSVISQDYPNLEYIIIDGASSDSSVEIIKKYQKHLSYWVSEKDKGLYDALQKGFLKSSGEIMGWINSDDLLHRRSLFVLASIFQKHPQVNWLQGNPTLYDETGMIVRTEEPVYSKYYFYLNKYVTGKYIQQESTYWRRTLWQQVGESFSSEYQLAGDFDLWMRFFQLEPLYCTGALIGGFRVRSNQLSRSLYQNYIKECAEVLAKNPLNHLDKKRVNRILWLEKRSVKYSFTRHLLKRWLRKLYGPKLHLEFNFTTGEFDLV